MKVVAVKDYRGSTSAFYQVEDGLILKSLHPAIAETDAYKLVVEKGILERLGEHPRIIKYRGFRDDLDIKGLLFAEASHGDLQNYIDQNNRSIDLGMRKKWCKQLSEAVLHLHCKGVIHSDLRPENCLVHQTGTALDILLCDFGGSMCQELGMDGRGLPDPPFWDLMWESTHGTDIFSLGSTFYTIITGCWPYRLAHPLEKEEDKDHYEERVIALLRQGVFPDVRSVTGGAMMMGCWKKEYSTAKDVLEAQNAIDF